MRKLVVLLVVLSLVFLANPLMAQQDVEKVTKEIVKAYQSEDAALLKKYVAGFFAMAINDNFFESDDGAPLVEIANKWDGKIKEIRYVKGDVMGQKVILAKAWISDNPNGNLNVVTLTSNEGNQWKAFALGINDFSRAEFEEGSTTALDEVASVDVKDHSGFSIEMANGEIIENPTTEKLEESLKTLNDENFYLILNRDNGFLQTSTSDQGYIIQYSDQSGMYEAEEYFNHDRMIEIFVAYIDDLDWKELANKWIKM